MGAIYFYMPEDALFVTSYWGKASVAEGNKMREARAADPSRKEARVHIIDLSDFQGTDLPSDTESEIFRALGVVYPQSFEIPTIVVSTDPHVFGEARIFETTVGLQPSGPGVKVVRTWKEAATLVGTDLSGVRAEIRRRQATADQQE